MTNWRYIAQNLLTGQFVNWNLPLRRDELTWELNGSGALRGTLSPETMNTGALIEWQTAIYAEADDEIRWGGILQNTSIQGSAFMIECAGFMSYPAGVPYVGTDIKGIAIDPSQIFMDLWAHLQEQPDGNVGVIVTRPTPVPIRVGTTEEPYTLVGAEFPDIGSELTALASETPFDYAESHGWAGADDVIDHTVIIGYPRIGNKRTDLSFVQGVNVSQVVPLARSGDNFANTIYAIGKGEGDSMIKSEVTQRDSRLRRPYVYTNKIADTKTRLTAEARTQLIMRSLEPDIATINVENHSNAFIGSWQCGDDILVQGTVPWYGDISIWCRIMSWSLTSEDSATLTLARSDRFAYGYTEGPEPAPVPPPVTTLSELTMTFNTHRDSADVSGHDWDSNNRKAQAIAAINSLSPTLMGCQECTPNQAKDIETGCNYKSIYRGNVRIFYRPTVWKVSDAKYYVLDASSDDRRLVAGTFTHIATGKKLRVGNTHLTNLDNGPGSSVDGWRLKQIRQALQYEQKLDLLFGDFNSEKDVYKVCKDVSGLEQSRNKTTVQVHGSLSSSHHNYTNTDSNNRRIDEVLTRANVKITSGGILDTDGGSAFPNASDHNGVYALIGM